MITPESLAKAGTEHAHQVALFCWAALEAIHHPELKLLFAIPNGGKRDKHIAAMLQAEGVRPGVPDVCLPIPRMGFHGLWIELKKPVVGKVSSQQTDFMQLLVMQGYCAAVCFGWEEARNLIIKYLTEAA